MPTNFDFPLSNVDMSWVVVDSDSLATICEAVFHQSPNSHPVETDRQRRGGLAPCQHPGDKGNHQTLLRRITHGDHKRESGQRVVGELGLPISVDEEPIACEECDKESCSASLIAIFERVVLHDEIQQIRSFQLYGRVHVMSLETLIESGDGTAQPALGIKAYQNVIGEFGCYAGDNGSRLVKTEF